VGTVAIILLMLAMSENITRERHVTEIGVTPRKISLG